MGDQIKVERSGNVLFRAAESCRRLLNRFSFSGEQGKVIFRLNMPYHRPTNEDLIKQPRLREGEDR